MTNIVDDAGIAYNVDRSSTQTNKPRVLKFSFGDGYEQRISEGINTLAQTYSVVFRNRPEAEMDTLIDFFETKAAVQPFAYSPPNYPSATGSEFQATATILGTGFDGFADDDWIIVEGSTSNDKGYAVDSTGTNNSGTLTVYEPAVTSFTESFTVYKAIGVICEEWSVTIPQSGILTVNAKLKRVYES